MRTHFIVAAIGAWLGAGLAQAGAIRTNYDAAMSFSLTVYSAGSPSTTTIGTKQIIQGLNGATNALGQTNQFSAAARLVYRQVLSGTNVIQTGQFVLDGAGNNVTATDVSSLVSRLPGVPAGVTNGNNVTTYSYDRFVVAPTAPALYPALNLEGVCRAPNHNILAGTATVLEPPHAPAIVSLYATVAGSFQAKVAGVAMIGAGANAVTNVVSGTISMGGGALE